MLSTILVYVALAVAVIAAVLALLAFQMTLGLNRNERDFRHLISAMHEFDDTLAALYDSHKRLRSRVGMRELREKRKTAQNAPTELEGEDWKREMRAKLHKGEIKP